METAINIKKTCVNQVIASGGSDTTSFLLHDINQSLQLEISIIMSV